MSAHSWALRPTKHFGEFWCPFAEIQVRTARGRFRTFKLLVDSGAVVSLLRRSSAEYLGLNLTSTQRIDLASVGGGIIAYVHHLEIRFRGGAPFVAPFAIGESEHVPNLLGRVGVFDRCRVEFDPIDHETRIDVALPDHRRNLT